MKVMIRKDGATLAVGTISHTTTRQSVVKGDRVQIKDPQARLLNVGEIISLEYDSIKKQNVISLKIIE